ncbi:MAG: hypothetical protein FVQ84_09775 [Planctomycetes bacterium]|nr:hypothetical protein [Planctomycetota bacterium]
MDSFKARVVFGTIAVVVFAVAIYSAHWLGRQSGMAHGLWLDVYTGLQISDATGDYLILKKLNDGENAEAHELLRSQLENKCGALRLMREQLSKEEAERHRIDGFLERAEPLLAENSSPTSTD